MAFDATQGVLTQTYKEVSMPADPIIYELGKSEPTRWGMWEVVTSPQYNENGTVIECQKHITVNPGASLSLQVHYGRGEVYEGLEGTTMVCVNGEIFEMKKGDKVHIPRGALHFSWNDSDVPSKFHEIQSGPLCDEADIMRSADKYKLAHELNDNADVVALMIKVCKERFDAGEKPQNDADLLHIYAEFPEATRTLQERMGGALHACITAHDEKTPAPIPDLKKKATCTCVSE